MSIVIFQLLTIALLFFQTLTETQADNAQILHPIKLPSAAEFASRRDFIKNMTLEAWTFYKKYAWGDYSVIPMQKKPLNLKGAGTGATIVSSLSTLYLMNLTEQYNQSKEWVMNQMNFASIDNEVDVYKSIIEHIGGFLSMYTLTKDDLFLKKAVEVGEAMKGAFNTNTGLPSWYYKPKRGTRSVRKIHTSRVVFEQPELHLLADLSNKISFPVDWKNRLVKISNFINTRERPNGTNLVFNSIDVESGEWISRVVDLTADSNEFFYNLIRSFILSSKQKSINLELYQKALLQFYKEAGMYQSLERGMLFFRFFALEPDLIFKKFDILSKVFEGSSCRMSALFALVGRELEKVARNSSLEADKVAAAYQWDLARNLTSTCIYLTELTKTKLLPDSSLLTNQTKRKPNVFKVFIPTSKTNFELAETYFIFWRLTKKPIWQERAWTLAQAIEMHLKTPNGGFGAIKSVDELPTNFDNYAQQDPQLISATFKYLYLTQVEDETILPLDKWVFNAAGHPLPICGQHSFYPKAACSK